MICQKCDAIVQDNSKFCPQCGANLVTDELGQQVSDISDRTHPSISLSSSKTRIFILAGAIITAAVTIVLILTLVVIPARRYEQAVTLFSEEQFSEAIIQLDKLPMNYKDVQALYPYYTAYATFADGNHQEASRFFASLNSYKDSANMKNECDYLYATSIIKSDSLKAKGIFSGLGRYKDSQARMLDCDYYAAISLLDAKDYIAAYAIFQELDDYRDSSDMLLECRYRKGLDLLDEKEYTEALERFIAIGDYKDAPERVLECHYLNAHSLLALKNYGEAFNSFMKAGEYQDSKVMLLECRYLYALELIDIGDYKGAEERLVVVDDYKDSPVLLLEVRYLQGIQLFDAKNYSGAETYFSLLGDYRDSASLLAETQRLKAPVLRTADGYSLSSGDTVYRGAGGLSLNVVLQGRVTSINGANSVNVRWEKALVMGILGNVVSQHTITYNIWGNGSYIASNGATMPIGSKTNYRANELYRYANNAW